MLTVKGIGGGGSPEVVNGRIEEMYAVDGEIQENTFIELQERVEHGLDDFVITGFDYFDEFDSYINFKDGVDSSLLIGGNRVTSTNPYSMELVSAKFLNGKYIQNAPVKVYESSDSVEVFPQSVNFAQISESEILMIWGYEKSSVNRVQIKGKLIHVDERGVLSVDHYSAVVIHEIVKPISYLSTGFVEARVIDSNMIAVVFAMDRAGSYSPYSYLYGFKADLNDMNNISVSEFRELEMLSNNGGRIALHLFEKYENSLILCTQQNANASDFEIKQIDLSSFTIRSNHGLMGFCHSACLMENSLFVFFTDTLSDRNIRAGLVAINRNDSGLISFLYIDSKPAFSLDTISSTIRTAKANNLCLVTAIPYGDVNRCLVARMLGIDNDTITYASNDTELIEDIITGGDVRSVPTDSKMDFAQIISSNSSSGMNQICYFSAGTVVAMASPSKSAIQGITKTKVSDTQKGQVWLLDTEKGES